MIGEKEIHSMLQALSVKQDDVVTVHSSLRSVGGIEGGADGLIDALCSYLSDGLLLIPTHTWANVSKDSPNFDVRSTVPCIGTLAKVAAFRKDAVRTLHPTHSLAIFGKRAAEYAEGEEKCASPAPLGSCLSRLYEENGKILLIGVGHDRNTYFHAVDERLDIPNRLNPETFVANITDSSGSTVQSPPFHTHYSKGISGCCSDFYPNYAPALEHAGAVKTAPLGNAAVICCDARRSTDVIRILWQRTDHDLCARVEDIPEEYYKDI